MKFLNLKGGERWDAYHQLYYMYILNSHKSSKYLKLTVGYTCICDLICYRLGYAVYLLNDLLASKGDGLEIHFMDDICCLLDAHLRVSSFYTL